MSESKSPDFDSIKQINPYGEEYWSARYLAPLLGYVQWRNFEQSIKKAIIACTETGNIVEYHFADASKPITGGKGAVQHVKDCDISPWLKPGASHSHEREFPASTGVACRTRVRTGLTLPPQANAESPSARMFRAALVSRS